MTADPVRAEAEVAERLELSELDALTQERLRDDRARDEARVLPRPVVVEHARDHARDAERIVVVHRQEVGRDLRRGIDRLRVDRRALVEDDPAVRVEVVVVGDRLLDVAVLLRGARGVELLELQPVVDDRLEQVERADDVGDRGLVRPMPRLADVSLRAEVEDVGAIGCGREIPDEIVDRRPVGQVGELDGETVAQMADIVERAARRRANERVHAGVEVDERLGQMRAHEAVGTGDEHRPPAVDVAELLPELGEGCVGPDRIRVRRLHRRTKSNPRLFGSGSGAFTNR